MTNSERIEAYFNNELPDAEKQQLLNDVDTDASLKSEFQFQQEIIDGIKAYRKQELIARLDQIQIISTGQSILIKAISVVGVAAVATLGTYLWMNSSSDSNITPDQVSKTEQVVAQPNEQPTETVTTLADDLAEEKIKDSAQQPANKVKDATVPNKTQQTPTTNTPEIKMPSVLEPTDSNSDVVTEDDLVAPEAMKSSEIKLSTSTNVEVKFSKKYNFHYQIKKGRLTLYGDFGDTLFEVIELKTNKGINSYLYFANHFYCLKTDSDEIRPLVVIEDQDLIDKLQERR